MLSNFHSRPPTNSREVSHRPVVSGVWQRLVSGCERRSFVCHAQNGVESLADRVPKLNRAGNLLPSWREDRLAWTERVWNYKANGNEIKEKGRKNRVAGEKAWLPLNKKSYLLETDEVYLFDCFYLVFFLRGWGKWKVSIDGFSTRFLSSSWGGFRVLFLSLFLVCVCVCVCVCVS